jgi:Coenzyme F390 synthetase
MGIYNFIDRNILLPIGDLMYGSSVRSRLLEFRRYDRMTPKEISDLQNDKLRKLVRHCYEHVPYYTKLFDRLGIKPEDIRKPEDLKKLPILTKQIIRDNYDDLIPIDMPKSRLIKSSTGGSTGTPLQFCKDAKEWSGQKAATLRAWEWYGLHLGDKIFSLGGNSIVKKKKKFSYKNIYDEVIMRNFKHSSADVTDDGMQKHYESLMRLKPTAIRGYGSSLYIFARYIEKKQLPVCPVRVVLTTGEVLVREYRRKIEQVFKAPVYDEYGAGDGGILSHECPLRDGLHIEESLCVIEITDKAGNVLPDGQVGYVTTTDLENYAFPFLRYRVGDMAYIKPGVCSCGRPSRRFGEVMGRAGRLVYNKQGVPISPTMLPIMMYPDLDYHKLESQVLYNKIDKFQIRQDKVGDIQVLLKMKDKADENPAKYDFIVTNYRNHFVGSEVSLSFVDEIPVLPSGKEDYCVSEFEYEG